jgi:hypothetical protein
VIARLALLSLVVLACGGEAREPSAATGRPLASAAVFAYGTTQGGAFASANTRGRVTAVLFVTTFDMASQLMARRVNEAARRHRPRINAGAVVLEAPSAAPLAEVFRQSLGLVYPVGMSDGADQSSDGPFGAIESVPTLVILDRDGRERARRSGVLSASELDELLTRALP